jgi:hypothetical protein
MIGRDQIAGLGIGQRILAGFLILTLSANYAMNAAKKKGVIASRSACLTTNLASRTKGGKGKASG